MPEHKNEKPAFVHIYLDDLRPCPPGFLLAKTANQCLRLLRKHKGKIKILSLDHDLGDKEKDGYWLVKRMVEEGLYAKDIFLHSANPVGRQNMLHYLVAAYAFGKLPAESKIVNSPVILISEKTPPSKHSESG